MIKGRALGVDISLNHAGFVKFDKGKPSGYRFVTDKKKVAQKSEHGTYLSAAKLKNKQERDVLRVAFWYVYLAQLFDEVQPEYVAIEDYAYKAPQSAYHLGEVGGVCRYYAWRVGAKIRLHDPMSLKIFAVHDGGADAHETMLGILDRWPDTAELYGHLQDGKDERTVQDLCDGYALAKLVMLEVALREGKQLLSKLHPKEIQLFNRTTKRYSENILMRDWIQRGA